MDESRIKHLLHQYFSNTIDRDDCELILQYLENADDDHIHPLIDEALNAKFKEAPFSLERKEYVYEQLKKAVDNAEESNLRPPSTSKVSTYRQNTWFRIAAMLLFLITIGLVAIWLLPVERDNDFKPAHTITHQTNDILLPDTDQAVLTLANGKTILVDDDMKEVFASESGVRVKKTVDGSIHYDFVGQKETGKIKELRYNTFSTPKGSSYQLTLADGSKVWLNTASTLRFPISFDNNERKVLLTGEAYFEIAHNSSQPFLVEANGSSVQVLGTHFNISAYEDEGQVTTTLLEGKVNVLAKNKTVMLKPGEQSIFHIEKGVIEQKQADIRSIMAWKNGYFRFDNEPMEKIMDKISRWYDIEEISYEGSSSDRFTGTFQRSKSIMQLFENLEKTASIKFEVKERRVKVIR